MSEVQRRFEEKFVPVPWSGCWLWTASTRKKGYGQFWMGGYLETAHRASWLLFVGAIPDELWVLHKCDVQACVNPDHLYLGTLVENTNDREQRARGIVPRLRGEANPAAKLKANDLIAIRAAVASGEPKAGVARRFGVSRTCIYLVCKGHSWRSG